MQPHSGDTETDAGEPGAQRPAFEERKPELNGPPLLGAVVSALDERLADFEAVLRSVGETLVSAIWPTVIRAVFQSQLGALWQAFSDAQQPAID